MPGSSDDGAVALVWTQPACLQPIECQMWCSPWCKPCRTRTTSEVLMRGRWESWEGSGLVCWSCLLSPGARRRGRARTRPGELVRGKSLRAESLQRTPPSRSCRPAVARRIPSLTRSPPSPASSPAACRRSVFPRQSRSWPSPRLLTRRWPPRSDAARASPDHARSDPPHRHRAPRGCRRPPRRTRRELQTRADARTRTGAPSIRFPGIDSLQGICAT
jgi:hypothetical protein